MPPSPSSAQHLPQSFHLFSAYSLVLRALSPVLCKIIMVMMLVITMVILVEVILSWKASAVTTSKINPIIHNGKLHHRNVTLLNPYCIGDDHLVTVGASLGHLISSALSSAIRAAITGPLSWRWHKENEVCRKMTRISKMMSMMTEMEL